MLPYVKLRQAKGNLVFQGIKDQKRLPCHSMSVKTITMLEIYSQHMPLRLELAGSFSRLDSERMGIVTALDSQISEL